MPNFQIKGLDHVGITVKDLNASADWYIKVLGLKKYKLEKWGEFPIFLLAGQTGIALFPQSENQDQQKDSIDHFAFNVSNTDFELARKHFESLNLKYTFKDHHYFHSLYINDPDGHVVELTTLIGKEEDFYQV